MEVTQLVRNLGDAAAGEAVLERIAAGGGDQRRVEVCIGASEGFLEPRLCLGVPSKYVPLVPLNGLVIP